MYKYMYMYKVLLPLSRKLVVYKSAPVATESHGLILKVTLSSLVTDGAVQRMVDKEKLHYTFSVGERKSSVTKLRSKRTT